MVAIKRLSLTLFSRGAILYFPTRKRASRPGVSTWLFAQLLAYLLYRSCLEIAYLYVSILALRPLRSIFPLPPLDAYGPGSYPALLFPTQVLTDFWEQDRWLGSNDHLSLLFPTTF